jgi:hypothetical protein
LLPEELRIVVYQDASGLFFISGEDRIVSLKIHKPVSSWSRGLFLYRFGDEIEEALFEGICFSSRVRR